MTIEVLRTIEVPEGTTVAAYTVRRLGPQPVVLCEYNETRRMWNAVEVISIAAADEAEHRAAVVRAAESWTVGDELYDADKTLVGVVYSVGETVPALNAFGPAQTSLVLSNATGVLADAPCFRKVINTTGAHAYELAPGGERWTVRLTTAEELTQFMAKLAFAMVTDVLSAAQVSKSVAEIQAIVVGLLQSDKGIDTYITEQFEQLERDRRQGRAVSLAVIPSL
jgi:hypothetical protein